MSTSLVSIWVYAPKGKDLDLPGTPPSPIPEKKKNNVPLLAPSLFPTLN